MRSSNLTSPARRFLRTISSAREEHVSVVLVTRQRDRACQTEFMRSFLESAESQRATTTRARCVQLR
eukprot:6196900-Pleurochrysis_carterae.AAC.6